MGGWSICGPGIGGWDIDGKGESGWDIDGPGIGGRGIYGPGIGGRDIDGKGESSWGIGGWGIDGLSVVSPPATGVLDVLACDAGARTRAWRVGSELAPGRSAVGRAMAESRPPDPTTGPDRRPDRTLHNNLNNAGLKQTQAGAVDVAADDRDRCAGADAVDRRSDPFNAGAGAPLTAPARDLGPPARRRGVRGRTTLAGTNNGRRRCQIEGK